MRHQRTPFFENISGLIPTSLSFCSLHARIANASLAATRDTPLTMTLKRVSYRTKDVNSWISIPNPAN